MFSFINIFTALFATMGPIKVLIVFAEKTRHLDGAVRRRIAVKAVIVATVVGLLFIFFGQFLMQLFKFSLGALTIAGGLILLLFALQMVLSEEEHEETEYGVEEAEKAAIYPLAVPLMASPMGIVVLTVASATKSVTDQQILDLIVAFLIVMAINLLALLLEDRIMHYISPEVLQVAHRILGILLVVRYAQAIMVPFLLSLFIAVIAAVPVDWLKKRGVSVPIAVGIVLVAALLIQILLGLMLGATVTEFTEALPGYQERLDGLMAGLSAWLLDKGIDITETGLADILDPQAALGFANTLMVGVGDVVSNAMLIMFTVLFMLLEAWSFPAKLDAMQGVRGGDLVAQFAKVMESTKHYVGAKALTSLATGVLVGVGLALVGLDFAVLWGFLAFALNFIPNIGSIIAAVPAVLLSLLQLGPVETLIVIAIYLVVNTVIGSIIEPGLMGRRVGLSTLTVFLSLVFWGWLLGPVGMLLSVPLTMVIKFAAQASEKTRWIAVLLAPAPQVEAADKSAVE